MIENYRGIFSRKNVQVYISFLEKIFSFFVGLRNKLYDEGLLKSHSPPCPLVSVGNILVGGTGKTPIVDFLLHWAKNQSLQAGVILRGYKGQFSGVQKVKIDNLKGKVDFFGDEASLLAFHHPDIPIFVGKDKKKVVECLFESHPVDFVLADDAFQHRRLKRDLDVVVLDALSSFEDFRLLPLGRGREPFSSLKRADFIVLNRVNLISSKEKEKKLLFLKNLLPFEKCVIEAYPSISSLKRLSDWKELKKWEKKRIFLVSGIAQPFSFSSLIQKQDCKIVGHKIFGDHYSYSLIEVKKIVKEGQDLKADLILTTEKDAVKFLKFGPLLPFFWMSQLEMRFDESILELKEAILKKVKEKKKG